MTIYRRLKKITYFFLMGALTAVLSGCGEKHEAYVSASTAIRNNTPVCLVPEAPGTVLYENSLVSVDASNASEGYLMIAYYGDNPKVKLQLTGPDYMTYTYDLKGGNYESFPLSVGDGIYNVGIYENVEGTQYATVFSKDLSITITNPSGAFLYPNQYVKFDSSSQVVAKAKELVAPAHDDLEAINYIYNYIIENFTYDYNKAETVQSGYIPNVDEILNSKTGICLDYAAVMASMLRSQQIPTKLEVGYAGEAYHAWISTYVKDIGWINGIIQFDGQNWSLMDPTFAANTSEKELKSFLGDGTNYVTKYNY